MSARYWLVKAPDDSMAETVLGLLATLQGDKRMNGVEVVHIVPEHRESNWMERAIAANYAALSPTDDAGAGG
jgi:hypothetical protein